MCAITIFTAKYGNINFKMKITFLTINNFSKSATKQLLVIFLSVTLCSKFISSESPIITTIHNLYFSLAVSCLELRVSVNHNK